MALNITSFRDVYDQIIKRLTFKQRIVIGFAAIVAIAAIIFVIVLSNRPNYSVLFSNLDPADASKIIDKLTEKSIKYELSENGKTVSVPKENVYELRLQLAGEGLPLNSVVGYEIFDKTNFGISDFQQKINYKRALEGELVRTISKLEAVEGAQVKIVMPEKSLFKEDQKKATASVILKLRSNRGLNQENIIAVSNLVASSVEGLEPSNITIIDSKGHLLSNNEPQNKIASMSAHQYDLKKKVESYLADKAQSMLDQVLGPNKSIVRVNADLNFNQIEKTQKSYDPNSVIRSQQQDTRSEIFYDTASESKHGMNITNFEIGETVEHTINEIGAIKRVSVAGLVDGTYKDSQREGQMVREFIPRTTEEMTKITGVIRQAVGLDDARGDQLSVENIVFDTNLEGDFEKKKAEFDLMDMIKLGLVVLAMIISVIVLISLLKVLKPRPEEKEARKREEAKKKKEPERIIEPIKEIIDVEKIIMEKPIFKPKEAKLPPIIELAEPEASEEELKALEVRRRVGEYLVEKPQDALNLVKLWLLEDEDK